MSYLDGLDDDQILEMIREDFRSALEVRKPVEERKIRDYKLYRKFNSFLSDGGLKDTSRGEHGWSRIEIPAVYWVVETMLSRAGVNVPKMIVTPRNPEAAPFAQAAQLRMDRHAKYCWYDDKAIHALKQMFILGDAPIKTPWDQSANGPGMISIPWFDWFVSAEAVRWYEAEILFHRTWHTKRSLQELARRDRERDKPVFKAGCLEELADMVSNRDAQDASWSPRREASGQDTQAWYDNAEQICMIEAHLIDGTRVVIGGLGEDPTKLLQVVDEPTFVDDRGIPFRPFTNLQNTPDLFTPYGISDAEMLEDHQREASTMRRQWIDQMTANLNAPIAFDETRIASEDVDEAYKGPNGKLPTHGANPNEVIARLGPGFSSQDFPSLYEMVRSEMQMIPGISDIASGQMQYGSDNTTATGMSIIASESNMRFRMKLAMAGIGFRRLAQNWFYLDRLMGSPVLGIPVASDFMAEQGQQGINMAGPGFVELSNMMHAPSLGAEFDVDVDAGAMAPPGQAEQVTKVRSLAMDLSGNPVVAGLVNWQAVAEALVEAAGYDPQRFLVQQPPAPAGMVPPGVPPGPAGPQPTEPTPPGDVFPGAQMARMPEPV